MAFKMKGSEFYGKLKLNRNMDNSSKSDGRSKSSAFQDKSAAPKFIGKILNPASMVKGGKGSVGKKMGWW